jgi:hypothetical protein
VEEVAMEKHTFTLRGEQLSLSKDFVERALRNAQPRSIKKYYVTIDGRDFPIKQVLSTATGKPEAGFITTDAYRILSNLGFEVKVE